MSRRLTDPTVYLVVWPDALLIKAGYSERQRWRSFAANPQVAALAAFRNHRDAFALEEALQIELGAGLQAGFGDPSEAIPYLGGRGAGWLETYRASSADRLTLGLELCLDVMRRCNAPMQCVYASHERMRALMHGRNGRTEKDVDVSHVVDPSDVSVRARETGISSSNWPAGATRRSEETQ